MIRKIFLVVAFIGAINMYAQSNIFEISRKGDVKAMKEILQKDASLIDSKNESGFTALILASYRNNVDVVSFLIEKGAKIDVISEMGTALMAATYKGNAEIVKILLDNGANPNSTDPNGTTALHYACLLQNEEIVKLIKAKNPKIDIKDNKGKTALDYAIALENIEIVKLLKKQQDE